MGGVSTCCVGLVLAFTSALASGCGRGVIRVMFLVVRDFWVSRVVKCY